MKIPFCEPNLSQLEKQYVNEAINSSWVGSRGDFIDRFEEKFAKFIGVRYAITCSSGTTALQLAYMACGMGGPASVTIPRDTFIATRNMAVLLCQNVREAEACADTWNISIDNVDTHFVVGVHLYGNPCDMGSVYKDKFRFIEDCAQSIGSKFKGKMTGSFGLASAFSFHSAKTMTTGEGGMVCTNDEDVAKRVRMLKNHAMTEPYKHMGLGFNYRMTNVQAAMGLAQLERIGEFIKHKKMVTEFYDKHLSSNLSRQKNTRKSEVVKWANAYRHDEAGRIRAALVADGIETRPGFTDTDNTIVLPCSTLLTDTQLSYIVECVNSYA